MILFEDIKPSHYWIENQKPAIIRNNNLSKVTFQKWKLDQLQNDSYYESLFIDVSATATADLCMTVGSCFALALKVRNNTSKIIGCPIVHEKFVREKSEIAD